MLGKPSLSLCFGFQLNNEDYNIFLLSKECWNVLKTSAAAEMGLHPIGNRAAPTDVLQMPCMDLTKAVNPAAGQDPLLYRDAPT